MKQKLKVLDIRAVNQQSHDDKNKNKKQLGASGDAEKNQVSKQKNDLYYKTAFHFMCKIYMVLEHVPRFYCESPVRLFSSLGEDEKY